MPRNVFGTSLHPPEGVERSSQIIKEILDDHELMLGAKKQALVNAKRNIPRLQNLIEAAWETVEESTSHVSRSAEFKIDLKLEPDLRIERDRYKELPGEISREKRNVTALEQELKEAEAREKAREDARKSRSADSQPPVRSAEKVVKKPLPSISCGIFSKAGAGKKPTIRREIVKVPVIAGRTATANLFFPTGAGVMTGTKRKAVDEPSQRAPVQRLKLLNGKAILKQPASSDPGPSSISPVRKGSDDQPAKVQDLTATKQFGEPQKTAPAPNCPGMLSDSKKRSAPEGEGSDEAPPGKRQKPSLKGINGDARAASLAKPSKSSKKVSKRRELNGTINHGLSCFSGVTIQLLDAALEDHAIDTILGEPSEVENFGVKNPKRFDNTLYFGVKDNGLLKREEKLRSNIKEAAKAGETEKVSVAKHLRKVLNDLGEYYHGKVDKNVSPYLFQSVVAWGAAEDEDRTSNDLSASQKLSGDTQEDCLEYYQTLLNTLTEDPHIGDAEKLKSLFEVRTNSHDGCSNEDCGYKSKPRKATDNSIDVPKKDSGDSYDLKDLFLDSEESSRQDSCPECSEKSLTTKTKLTKVSDNFVMRLNKTAFDATTLQTSRVDTLVDLKPQLVKDIIGTHYSLTAVIIHDGPSTHCGHYTIFRRHNDNWYLLNDKDCTKKDVSDVKDTPRGGHSAMLLYKKI